MHSCRIIPERGSWIELNVTRKESLAVRIDQSGKFSAMTLLRAMDPQYSDNAAILRAFYETQVEKIVDGRSVVKVEGKMAVGDIVYPPDSPRAGEIIVECGQKITKNIAETICTSGLTDVEVMPDAENPLILNALADDATASHEEALLRIYQRLRPGNPAQLEKAKALFHEKFYDTNRYRLGRVGRFRINRKLGLDIDENGNDAAARRLDRGHPLSAQIAEQRSRPWKSTTSTTWATAACGPSTSWPATRCARGFSSFAARCRSG